MKFQLKETPMTQTERSMTPTKPLINRWTVGGILLLAIVVALGIWGYPEFRRTIRMHSM